MSGSACPHRTHEAAKRSTLDAHMTNRNPPPLPEAQMGPAEKLLDLILNASAHLWHNRPGLDVGGQWYPAKGKEKFPAGGKPTPVTRGLHVPAAGQLYTRLLSAF